jgi:undecaprenyl-diphosphatase
LNLQHSLLLGVVQGLTEFIPISSTAHLILVPQFVPMEAPSHAFDVALHFGTLLAVLAYFWSDWVQFFHNAGRILVERRVGPEPGRRLAFFVMLGCIPAVIAGILFEKRLEQFTDPDRHPISLLIMGCAAVGMALLMWWADARARKARSERHLAGFDAWFIGAAQALALIPGVSRSGATITAGLMTGLTREAAARFSFLLSTPIIAGAVAYKLKDILKLGLAGGDWAPCLVGTSASAIVGYLCIRFLIGYLKKRPLGVFVAYRVFMGVFLIGIYIFNH